MTKPFDQYPLVQKALSEQDSIFARFEDGMPPELQQVTARVLSLLDGCDDRKDREDLMAVAVLMNCPPYISLKSARFTSDYNAHVQSMLDTHVIGDGVTPANDDLIQVYSAMFISHGENMLRQINAMSEDDKHWLADVKEGIEEYLDDRNLIAHKISPTLLATEDALIKTTLETIHTKLRPAPKNTHKPKPAGPKGP